MASAAQKPGANVSVRPFFLSKFFLGLLALMLALAAIGLGGFWSLVKGGPLSLIQGGDRPIAAATAFVPATSPFTLSLLTQPDKLVALQQALTATSHSDLPSSQLNSRPSSRPNSRPPSSQRSNLSLNAQQRTRREIEQLKQSLLKNTGLDYDRDLQPWIGNEVTFAFTDIDLDQDEANAQQPGYLLAIEIGVARQQQARDFLQLFWQQQSLAGNPPQSEQVSGARVLYTSRQSPQSPKLTAASALVGDRFVIFANDVRVLRRSIHAGQSATNLAQNRTYRQTVAQLPQRRIGLAYLDTALLSSKFSSASRQAQQTPQSFVAIGLGIARAGITADIQLADIRLADIRLADIQLTDSATAQSGEQIADTFIDALKFLPANTALALASHNLAQLEPALSAIGVPKETLPVVFQWEQNSVIQDWATADYALAQINAGQSNDWILAVAPDPDYRADGVARLDAVAKAKGYSAVPVTLEGGDAIAWTRLSTRNRGRSSTDTFTGTLETEILGLHLQQDSYEIFAGSLVAMEAAMEAAMESGALAAPTRSLLSGDRFTQAIATLSPTHNGYLYADWSAIEPTLSRNLPMLKRIEAAARPFISHIDTLVATREGPSASAFIRLEP
jgi:hypothetical protein